MEAELFKTIAHVAPPEQIPAGKWLTTLNALLKRDVQGGMKNLYAAVCAPSEGLGCRPLCQEEHDFVRQLIRFELTEGFVIPRIIYAYSDAIPQDVWFW